VPATLIATLAASAAAAVASPYLARLTLSVPDREDRHWWRGRSPGRARIALSAVIAAILGALAGAGAGWGALFPALLALALIGTPLVIIDFEHHRLPNRLVFAAALAGAVLLALAAALRSDWHLYLRALEGGAAVYAVLFLVAFAAPRSFGFGDVKLGGVLGGYLGWFGWACVYYGIFAGFLLGMFVSIALLATRRASLKTALAFGPMLILGSLIVLAFRISPSLSNSS
jgi:leader peptidase (prepilin peptidase)/N-methyltransferase